GTRIPDAECSRFVSVRLFPLSIRLGSKDGDFSRRVAAVANQQGIRPVADPERGCNGARNAGGSLAIDESERATRPDGRQYLLHASVHRWRDVGVKLRCELPANIGSRYEFIQNFSKGVRDSRI